MNNHTMYQAHVTNHKDEDVAIGPLVNDPDFLVPLVQGINLAVAKGKERDWRDARIEKVVKLAN